MSLATYCCFFFSSRRRHTRCSRDWSSDVCSSDLVLDGLLHRELERLPDPQPLGPRPGPRGLLRRVGGGRGGRSRSGGAGDRHRRLEIGRGSWRGRGEISGVAGSLKKKKKSKIVRN